VVEHTLVGSAQAAPPGGGTGQPSTVRIDPGGGQTGRGGRSGFRSAGGRCPAWQDGEPTNPTGGRPLDPGRHAVPPL